MADEVLKQVRTLSPTSPMYYPDGRRGPETGADPKPFLMAGRRGLKQARAVNSRSFTMCTVRTIPQYLVLRRCDGEQALNCSLTAGPRARVNASRIPSSVQA
jgi:hypothetical protein